MLKRKNLSSVDIFFFCEAQCISPQDVYLISPAVDGSEGLAWVEIHTFRERLGHLNLFGIFLVKYFGYGTLLDVLADSI